MDHGSADDDALDKEGAVEVHSASCNASYRHAYRVLVVLSMLYVPIACREAVADPIMLPKLLLCWTY